MKIAIIEDEQLHADLLIGYLNTWGEKRNMILDISAFPSAEAFLFSWEEQSDFDVLFVDIQMKAMNGMDMAKHVRKKDCDIAIIFTTGIADYIEEGYEVEAMHYLLKPISREKVERCLDKVKSRRKEKHFVLLHHLDEIRKLDVEKINYAEARGHKCILGISGEKNIPGSNGKELEVAESISELEEILVPYHFMKCHRSYLCRIENIHHIDKKEIYFDDGSHIPVSRRMYGEVNQAFIKHFRKF